jgi:hypothetical protein
MPHCVESLYPCRPCGNQRAILGSQAGSIMVSSDLSTLRSRRPPHTTNISTTTTSESPTTSMTQKPAMGANMRYPSMTPPMSNTPTTCGMPSFKVDTMHKTRCAGISIDPVIPNVHAIVNSVGLISNGLSISIHHASKLTVYPFVPRKQNRDESW